MTAVLPSYDRPEMLNVAFARREIPTWHADLVTMHMLLPSDDASTGTPTTVDDEPFPVGAHHGGAVNTIGCG